MENGTLCPLDGRYRGQLGTLRQYMAEAAFAAARLRVETTWLTLLCGLSLPSFKPLNSTEKTLLDKLTKVTAKELAV